MFICSWAPKESSKGPELVIRKELRAACNVKNTNGEYIEKEQENSGEAN